MVDILINDLSLNGQYTSFKEFEQFIKDNLIPFLKYCDERNLVLYKKTDFYQRKVTVNKSFNDFLHQKGNPVVSYLLMALKKRFFSKPFWDEENESKIDANAIYTYELEIEKLCCLFEASERDRLVYSFSNSNFSEEYIKIYKNNQEIIVRSIFNKEDLKHELFIVRNPLNKSIVLIPLQYTFKMYQNEDHHNVPHFHVIKGDYKASISIPNFEIVVGSLQKQTHLKDLQEWAEQNKEYIIHLWNQKHPDKLIYID